LLEHLSVLTEKSSENSLKEILKELGPAPPQLPRKDNANVELLLVNRFKGSDSTETKEMKPEQIYTETKYLLFTIIKAVPPSVSAEAENDIKHVLDQAAKYALEKKDFSLAEKVKKKNLPKLCKVSCSGNNK